MPTPLSVPLLQAMLGTKVLGRPLAYRPEVDSTQEWGRVEARSGAPQGTVFLTDHQTFGRGRLGRTWSAPPHSSVLLSVLVRPERDLYSSLFMVAGLAAVMAIEAECGIPCSIKWPNDVLIKGNKVAGVLTEGEFLGDAPDFALVGIGINVNLDPAALNPTRYPATSLSQELGTVVSRERLIAGLLLWFERMYEDAAGSEAIPNLWRARLDLLGWPVTIVSNDESIEGTATSVDTAGALTLTLPNGERRTFVAGDVSLSQ